MRALVIVDTSVWIDFLRGVETSQSLWLREALGGGRVAITDLIYCEVLQGIRDDEQFLRVRTMLRSLAFFQTGGERLAVRSAQNYRVLRALGVTVRKTIDCLIATFCIERGLWLMHSDADFNGFEQHLGLRVLHPAQDKG